MASSQFSESKADVTTKITSALQDLKSIRIVMQPGRGFGSQRCGITLMLKLRELGFQGAFEVFFSGEWEDISARLTLLFSSFKPVNIKEANLNTFSGQEPRKLVSLQMPDLGCVTIIQIPGIDYLKACKLPPTELTFIPGLFHLPRRARFPANHCPLLNSDTIIMVQPTDWQCGISLVDFKDVKRPIEIDPSRKMRLSANTPFLLPSSEHLTLAERNILECCESKNVNTQLVYGLYKAPKSSSSYYDYGSMYPRAEEKTTIDPARQCKNLIKAHRLLQETICKSVILFFPQEIISDKSFRSNIEERFDEIMWLDLTAPTDLTFLNSLPVKSRKIILAYTGNLSLPFFESLLLSKTNLPPVIEGCNARESCEYNGRPFLHGGWDETKGIQSLKEYSSSGRSYYINQELHAKASLCLQEDYCSDVTPLFVYMWNVLRGGRELLDYHRARQLEYLKRPDVCESALQVWINRIAPNVVEEDNESCRPSFR